MHPPQAFIDAANDILNSKSSFCEDHSKLQRFYDVVEFFQDVFGFQPGNLNPSDVDGVMTSLTGEVPEELSKSGKSENREGSYELNSQDLKGKPNN